MIKRAFSLALALTLPLGAGTALAQQAISANDMADMQAAYALYVAGEYDKAAKAYQQIEEGRNASEALKAAALSARTMTEVAKLRMTLAAGENGFLEKNRVTKFLRLSEGMMPETSFTYSYLSSVVAEDGDLGAATFDGAWYAQDWVLLTNRIEAPDAALAVEPVIEVEEEPAAVEVTPEEAPAEVAVVTPPATIPEVVSKGRQTYAVTNTVNVRGGPGTEFEKVGGLTNGEIVTGIAVVLDNRGRRWVQLADNGGYVSETYVTPASLTAAVTPKPQTPTVASTPPATATKQIVATPKTQVPAGACSGSGSQYRVVAPKGLAVYEAPSTRARSVGKLNPGDTIQTLGTKSGFYAFKFNGRCAFVSNIAMAYKRL